MQRRACRGLSTLISLFGLGCANWCPQFGQTTRESFVSFIEESFLDQFVLGDRVATEKRGMLHERVSFGSRHRTQRSSWSDLHCYRPWLSIDGVRCTAERKTSCSYCVQARDAILLHACHKIRILPWPSCRTHQGVNVFEGLIAVGNSSSNP